MTGSASGPGQAILPDVLPDHDHLRLPVAGPAIPGKTGRTGTKPQPTRGNGSVELPGDCRIKIISDCRTGAPLGGPAIRQNGQSGKESAAVEIRTGPVGFLLGREPWDRRHVTSRARMSGQSGCPRVDHGPRTVRASTGLGLRASAAVSTLGTTRPPRTDWTGSWPTLTRGRGAVEPGETPTPSRLVRGQSGSAYRIRNQKGS